MVATSLGWKQVRKRPQQLELPRARWLRRPATAQGQLADTQHSIPLSVRKVFSFAFIFTLAAGAAQSPLNTQPSSPTYPNSGTFDPSSFPAPVRSTQMEKKHRAGLGMY